MNRFIEETFEQQVKDLQNLITIPSVSRGEPQEGMPYGKNVYRALEEAKGIARKLGFKKVFDVEGRCGVVEYGEGEEILAVMAHLDVVPEGTGWDYPPYGAEIHDGKMYGRGTADDKGAAVSALYALAAVKNSGVKMKRRVRVLLGCDEERGSTGMARYREVEGEPTMAFTPDGEYPVVNSEMNILHITYRKNYEGAVFANVGAASNVIPGEAEAKIPGKVRITPMSPGFTGVFSGDRLHITGREGHASTPDKAQNALLGLIEALSAQDLPREDSITYRQLSVILGMYEHGEGMGVDREDASGRLTLAPTVLEAGEKGVELIFDCRYPASMTFGELKEKLDIRMGTLGFTCKEYGNSMGHYISPDSELVSSLMEVYRELTGDKEAKPLSMGGGTYAREFKNAVAFGPAVEGVSSPCHIANEYVGLEEMRFNTQVMAEAIKRLAAE